MQVILKEYTQTKTTKWFNLNNAGCKPGAKNTSLVMNPVGVQLTGIIRFRSYAANVSGADFGYKDVATTSLYSCSL